MNMDKIIHQIVDRGKKDPQVITIFLFGSYLNKREYRDIDIALVLQENLTDLEMGKKRLSYQSEVPEIFDIQVLQLLPAHVQLNVLKGKLLYCRNYDRFFDMAINIIREGENMKRKIQLLVSP